MKLFVSVLVLILTFQSTVGASDIINSGMSDLALSAQHYYNTQMASEVMTILRKDLRSYEISYRTEDYKIYSVTINEMDWGTWNLGDMSYRDLRLGGAVRTIIGGSTDWEYVFRVFNPIDQTAQFTGGNHGSETLSSIKFYDGVTGEEINLDVEQSQTVQRLVIEEDTKLLIANKESLPYANVHRQYTIVGTDVILDSRVEFLRNVQMTLSYSAMASVSKEFATTCSFGDELSVTASSKGNCTGEYFGKTDATICTFQSEDSSASLTVGILNKADMTDNFSNENKTFLWDMSEGFTKLYFSKYKMSAVENVAAGTVWNFSTFWRANL